ncbi:hypothetical protein FJTKL_07414 [Diaporthe vaccinii]|uniref:Uncharacterized protein n=1 Tax=Diaporthe vaccinii TaxID=105482 RepID=A0ABR4ETZ8_9PEZI
MQEQMGREPTDSNYAAFLADYEGLDIEDEEDFDSADDDEEQRAYAVHIMDQAYLHSLSPEDNTVADDDEASGIFTLEARYSKDRFQGIMPDTGAAAFSTVGREQFLAHQRHNPSIQMDTSRASEALIKFRQGPQLASLGTIMINTLIRDIVFHVINAPTPFLLCI